MEIIFSTLINGLSLGGIYAMIALGYTMVYGIAKMLNFAHGDIIMIGGYLIYVFMATNNPLLAIVLALLINYFIVMHTSRSVKASNSELLSGIYTKVNVKNPTKKFLHQTKRYSPQNTDSNNGARSRSSGGFSGGSSGGGGGSRGGGGGHKF